MKNMKKVLIAVLGLSMLIAGLAACSSGANERDNGAGGNNQSQATETPASKTKLQYWTGGRHDADYIKSMIDKFNETNTKNIEVEMTIMAENYAQSLDLAFVSEQAPDVMTLGDLVDLHNKGYVEPLDQFLTPEFKERFGENAFIEGANMLDGQIYTLPANGSTIRLIYNVDIFEKAGIAEPPKTLDEMVETAKKITEVGKKDGIYGFALNYKSPTSALDRSSAAIAEINGTHGTGFDFKTGQYDFTGYKPIIEAFKQMKDDGSTLPGSESLDIDPLRAQFAEGNIGMYLSYSVEPGVYKNQFPAKIKWDAALPPSIDGTYSGVNNLGTGASRWLAMSSQSKNKEAAWEFMSFLYSDEVLKGYQEQGLGLSTVPSVAAIAEKPDIEGIDNFLPGKYDGRWPIHPQGIKPEGKSYQEEFVKYILVGGDLDGIVKDLNERYNAALEKEKATGKKMPEAIPDFDPAKLQGSLFK